MLSQEFYDALHKLEAAEPSPGREVFNFHNQPSDHTYLAHIAPDDPRLLELRKLAMRDETVGRLEPGMAGDVAAQPWDRDRLLVAGRLGVPCIRPGSLRLERLRADREARGIGQREMARRLGLSQSQYSRRERGSFRFELDLIRRAAYLLNADPTSWLNHGLFSGPVMIRPWEPGERTRNETTNKELDA